MTWPAVGAAMSGMPRASPGGGRTLTVTVAVTLPAAFVALRTYVVVALTETSRVPERARAPPRPEMETLVAPEVVHARVEAPAEERTAGVAVKEVICGRAGARVTTVVMPGAEMH